MSCVILKLTICTILKDDAPELDALSSGEDRIFGEATQGGRIASVGGQSLLHVAPSITHREPFQENNHVSDLHRI